MVTPDFLASDFIHEHELGPLLKEAEQGGVKILWVPVRDSAYKLTPLKNHQAVLDPSKPPATLPKAKRDQAWRRICEEIERAVNKREPRESLPFSAVESSGSAHLRPVGQEVPLSVQGESKRHLITSIEFTLERSVAEFDEQKFKIALKLATGIEASQIRIAKIRSGSTIVNIDGEQEILVALIRKIQSSLKVAH